MVCTYSQWDCKNKDYKCPLSGNGYCRYDNQEECEHYEEKRRIKT